MTIDGRGRGAALIAAATLLVGVTACTGSDPDSDGSGSAAGTSPGTSAASPTASGSGATSPGRPTLSPTGTVATGAGQTRAPVPISSSVSFGRGVTARITQVRSVQAKANLPGEISGPAIAVTIRLSNGASRATAIQPVVNLYYGPDQSPATSIDGTPSKPFGSRLGARADATGTYTFTLGTAQRSLVRVEFSYTPTAPVVLWQGSVS